MINLRTQLATTTSVNLTQKGADVISMNLVNRHSAAIFVKFYDSVIATFQDTPLKTYEVKANDSFTVPSVSFPHVFSSSNGLCVRAVTGATDGDNTAPGTLPIIEISVVG